MLSKTKQRFLNAASFIVLIAFLIWAAPGRRTESFFIAALIMVAVCAGIIALAYRWDKPGYFDWAIASYFIVILGLLLFWPETARMFLRRYAASGINICFFAAAFFPPLIGLAPFTVHRAKKRTQKEFWNDPIFININRIITYVWAAIFALNAVMCLYPSLITRVIIPNALVFIFGFPFSSRFPDYYLQRLGVSSRPDSLESFMRIMSMGFNPPGAGDTITVIQFTFSGDVDGSCHFNIKDGKIEAYTGVAEKADLIIEAPFNVWVDIMIGKAEGHKMFMEQKFKASGNLSILTRMSQFFKKRPFFVEAHTPVSRMKFIPKIILVMILALVIGGLSVYGFLKIGSSSFNVKNGPWITHPSTGGQDAGIYTRLVTAVVGTLALNRSEVIYYFAKTDDDGQALRSKCDYRIEGKDMDARWWSITLYGSDLFLIPNDQDRYSYNMMNLKREKDGRYKIYLSQNPKAGNWLPTRNTDKFYVSIRLYRPKPSVYENMGTIELPRIIRETCQ
jgi:hypothetical protein